MSLKDLDVSKLPAAEAGKTEIREWANQLTEEQWKELVGVINAASKKPDSKDSPSTGGATGGAGSSQNAVIPPTNNQVNHVKIPTLPIFNGAAGKGNEVSYTQWKYAVKGLQGQHADSAVLQAIRQSVRGRGFDALYTLGDSPTLTQVISKFDTLFGKTLSQSEAMKELYGAEQKESESITTWSCRLEGLMIDAINCDAIQVDKRVETLRKQFWNGLCNSEVKNALRHKVEAGISFEDLISAARSVEKEVSSTPVMSATAQKAETSMDKMESLIKRLESLESREIARANATSASNFDSRDRQNYQHKPRGKCFLCNRPGHFKSQCWFNKNNKHQGNDQGPTKGGM